MPKRKRLGKGVETDVLVKCGRRCCLCYGLQADFSEKPGQIAHIDRNPANDQLDNLVFLCLEHHDIYDSRTSQSKGVSKEEIFFYRGILHADVERKLPRLASIDERPARNGKTKFQQFLVSTRKSQPFKSCMLNGYEIQKANEKGLLIISPFSSKQLSIAGYTLSVGDYALSDTQLHLDADHPLELGPGKSAHIVTREFVGIPQGVVGRITTPRGSLSRLGLSLASMGLFESGFFGSLVLTIVNWGPLTVLIEQGLNIALMEFVLINDPPSDWRC